MAMRSIETIVVRDGIQDRSGRALAVGCLYVSRERAIGTDTFRSIEKGSSKAYKSGLSFDKLAIGELVESDMSEVNPESY